MNPLEDQKILLKLLGRLLDTLEDKTYAEKQVRHVTLEAQRLSAC
jgi:hypothetical protein